MSSEPSEHLPVTVGRYELTELIGQGDVGEVFAARSHGVHGFEKRLVVKRIRRELSEDQSFVDAFAAEARLAVTLSHTNIVQVLELGQDDGLLYIVMEYVAGPDLSRCNVTMRTRHLPWPLQLAAFVVAEVAKGLDHAHRRRDLEGRPLGIVHQDVSPGNVLLSHEGEVKITDFGMAAASGIARLDRAADPRYMAPEQIRGEAVDPRTDVYACGVLLLEMISGRAPWAKSDRAEAVARLQRGEVPRLAPDLEARTATDLVTVLKRATAPSPDDRYLDASALYEALMSTIFASGRVMGRRELADLLVDIGEVQETTDVNPEEVQRALGSWSADLPVLETDYGDDDEKTNNLGESADLVYEQLATDVFEVSDEIRASTALPEPLVPTPMRGRRSERHLLAEAVARAAHGERQVVEVVGPEGIGKTRLVNEVVGKLRSGGAPFSFYRASCLDTIRFGRFGAARSLLRAILGVADSTPAEELVVSAARIRELGVSRYELEALQDVVGAGPGGAPPGRRRSRAVARGLARVLKRLGEETLTIAFLDDADLMDPDSARLLPRVIRHTEGGCVVVVLARRDGPSPWPDPVATTTIEVGSLRPSPLNQVTVDTFGSRTADRMMVETVSEVAAGNPRYALELVRLLIETERARVDGDSASLAPGAIVPDKELDELLVERLDVRTEIERAVLEVGACIGMRFEVELTLSTTGLAPGDLRPVLEALVAAGMLLPQPPAACRFASDTLRKQVLDTLDEEDLSEIHGRISEAMAGVEGKHEPGWRLRTAGHLHQAGHRERARDLLATSAAQLEVAGATDAAIDHFAAALELTKGSEEAPVALALAMRTANLAARTGRLREGLRAVNLAAELARENRNGTSEIEALVLAGRLLGVAGRVEDASSKFRAALGVAEKIGDNDARRRIRGAMGELLVEAGDYRRAAVHLEEALGDPAAAAEAPRFLLMAAMCRGLGGDGDLARDMLARVEAATDEGDDAAIRAGRLRVAGLLDVADDRTDDAVVALKESRDLARRHGLHHDNALASHVLGCALLAGSMPQKAFASLWYSYELAREHGFERLTRLNLVVLAALDVLAHGSGEPIDRILHSLADARESGLLGDILQTRYYLGRAFLAAGHVEDGRRQLEQARRMCRATGNLLYANDIERHLAALG